MRRRRRRWKRVKIWAWPLDGSPSVAASFLALCEFFLSPPLPRWLFGMSLSGFVYLTTFCFVQLWTPCGATSFYEFRGKPGSPLTLQSFIPLSSRIADARDYYHPLGAADFPSGFDDAWLVHAERLLKVLSPAFTLSSLPLCFSS